jgi:DNA polymerase V
MPMYSLSDATGCYASIEKVFDPSIRHRPVVVLSNNDGCIVAMCPIAKSLGIPKFQPYFKVRGLLQHHKVVVRSSNYELYGDVSDKMMSVIARFSDNTYQYSIDEAFSKFDGFHGIVDDWYSYGHKIRKATWRECRMPIGVGFGPTLTLAKAANHASKKLAESDGSAVIDDEYSRQHFLKQMSLDDVWGIGSKLSSKLNVMGLKTALDLANCAPKVIRKQFGVTVERTVEELNGRSCLSWDDVRATKKEIYSTRSLGQRITNYNDLRKALTDHAVKVCNSARSQQSLIKTLYLFASSSPHDERYTKKGIMYEFPMATDNICALASAVEHVMHVLYIQGVAYYRCGVGAVALENKAFQQHDLFLSRDNSELMKCYSQINGRFGKGTLQVGSEGKQEKWGMRREFLSPRYTTRWTDIPKILC